MTIQVVFAPAATQVEDFVESTWTVSVADVRAIVSVRKSTKSFSLTDRVILGE